MTKDIELVRAIARAPLRTARFQSVQHFGSNPWRTLTRIADHGGLAHLTQGIYTAPPDGRDGRTWKPTLEAAALAVATARFGNRNAILMGLGAARYWAALPRAIGITTVAVPVAGRAPVTINNGATAHFIPRDLDHLDAVLERTELGEALVTTPAQTLFDLVMKPNQGGAPDIAAEAARLIAAQVSADDLSEVIDQAGRANNSLRQILKDLEERDDLT